MDFPVGLSYLEKTIVLALYITLVLYRDLLVDCYWGIHIIKS